MCSISGMFIEYFRIITCISNKIQKNCQNVSTKLYKKEQTRNKLLNVLNFEIGANSTT